MPKSLNELTIKELGKLFPVRLSDPDPNWKAMFAVESARIIQVLAMDEAKIHHMGSTAVPQLCAKPTIDMLLEIPETADIAQVTDRLGQIGYDAVPRPGKPPPHLMFARGYTPTGYRGQAYHIHLRYFGDWDELYFRDYLIRHPIVAKEYAALKQKLAIRFRNDREAYTQGKTKFVQRISALAREEK